MLRELKNLVNLKFFNGGLLEVKKYLNPQTSIQQTLKVEVVPIIHKNVNHAKESASEIISKTNVWYTKFLGLDEVKLYQQRVVDLQDKLLDVQEQRREISKELSNVRSKSNEIQDEIHKIKRQDDIQRYLYLMKEEAEVLKQELNVTAAFNDYDRQEREIFTAYINAVKDSHEKQRAQLEYTKYFGLILSVVGSFLTFCYSTLKKQDLKHFIEKNLLINSETSKPILLQLQENQKDINKVVKYIDDNKHLTREIHSNYMQLLRKLNIQPLLTKKPLNIDNTVQNQLNTEHHTLTHYAITAIVGYIILKTIIG